MGNPQDIQTTQLMIVAGEASGDLHAAHLVEAIHHLDPNIRFSGLGGPLMQDAGVEIYQDITKIAVVGFVEVLKHYGKFKKAFDLILGKIKEQRPAAVILVDYPGFNLRLAQKIKKLGIKVIYYISPQVWAWKANRVEIIRECVDKMLVLFPFEKEFYKKFNINVTCVGHPLVNTIQVESTKEDFLRSAKLSTQKLTIGLLPGSREKEVQIHLPIMVEAAEILAKEFTQIQFLVARASTIPSSMIEASVRTSAVPMTIIEKNTYDAVHACDLCMVASGTATLETAILGKPMVVIYKTSLITWALARIFIKIPYIGLVNVVAGKKIVPECIQFEATGPKMAEELKNIFTNELKIVEIKEELRKVKDSLGESGASQRAAEAVLSTIRR